MKKSLIFTALFFIFVASLEAQWTTNRWYGLYWGWEAPASNDYSSELYRNGSFSIKEPAGHSILGLTMQSKGYLFFDGQNRNGQ